MALEKLFLFGTLRHELLLTRVLGRAPLAQNAVLKDHAIRQVENADFPVLVSAPSHDATGLLIDVSPQERARLDYYEAGFDYTLAPETVHTTAGPISALVYRAPNVSASSLTWDLEAWVAHLGDMTLEAAEEIMRAYEAGIPAKELAPRMGILRARAHASALTRKSRRPVTIDSSLTQSDVTVLETRHPYEAFFRVDEVTLTHRGHRGDQIGPIERAVFNVCDAVTVLPYDPVRDRVLLVEQLRIGALMRGDTQPWLLEPIAGMIDAGEAPEETALREAREEAHLSLDPTDLRFVAAYYPSPGGVAQRLLSYIAVCDLPDAAAGLGGEAAEHEDLRAHLVPFEQLTEMVRSGEAANAPLILSAQWLQINKRDVQASA